MPAASTLPYMQQQDMPMAPEASIEGIGSVRGRGCRRPCSQTAVAVSAGRQTIRACELGRSSLKREMQPPPFLFFLLWQPVAAHGATTRALNMLDLGRTRLLAQKPCAWIGAYGVRGQEERATRFLRLPAP